MSAYIYTFLGFDATTRLLDISEELADADDEWEVVSHSQTPHGMSVLLRRLKTNDEVEEELNHRKDRIG